MTVRYDKPPRVAIAANLVIRWLAELGISIAGTTALRVRGRTTANGAPWSSMCSLSMASIILSPRGNTQWARNVRAAGEVEVGPRWRRRPRRASELADSAKPELLRRYLDRWYWEVKGHMAGLTPDSDDDQLRTAAPSIPLFALMPSV